MFFGKNEEILIKRTEWEKTFGIGLAFAAIFQCHVSIFSRALDTKSHALSACCATKNTLEWWWSRTGRFLPSVAHGHGVPCISDWFFYIFSESIFVLHCKCIRFSPDSKSTQFFLEKQYWNWSDCWSAFLFDYFIVYFWTYSKPIFLVPKE